MRAVRVLALGLGVSGLGLKGSGLRCTSTCVGVSGGGRRGGQRRERDIWSVGFPASVLAESKAKL